jgi:hypothetical protein
MIQKKLINTHSQLFHNCKMQCQHCFKEYKRENAFKRHLQCCAILSKSKKERQDETESIEDTPPLNEVYRLVQTLVINEQRLRKRIESLEKSLRRADGRKEDILGWLGNNIKPAHTFQNWIDSIKLTEADLENVFQNDFIEGIFGAISRVSEDIENPPFRCFQHQSNTFYVYTAVDEDSQWVKAPFSLINNFIDKITQKIIELFKKWQDEQGDAIYTESGSRTYHKNVRKVMGGTLPREVSQARLRGKIFNRWKTDIRGINI